MLALITALTLQVVEVDAAHRLSPGRDGHDPGRCTGLKPVEQTGSGHVRRLSRWRGWWCGPASGHNQCARAEEFGRPAEQDTKERHQCQEAQDPQPARNAPSRRSARAESSGRPSRPWRRTRPHQRPRSRQRRQDAGCSALPGALIDSGVFGFGGFGATLVEAERWVGVCHERGVRGHTQRPPVHALTKS